MARAPNMFLFHPMTVVSQFALPCVPGPSRTAGGPEEEN